MKDALPWRYPGARGAFYLEPSHGSAMDCTPAAGPALCRLCYRALRGLLCMEILYVAHCVPWPPDKGERIRAFHSVSHLAEHHRVLLACIAKSPAEAAAPSALRERLASVRIEVLDVRPAILRGFLGAA